MPYHVQLELPRVVQIGRAASLTLPVRSDGGGLLTPSSGTLTVTVGGTTVLDEVTITNGPPPSYALLAASTTSLAPSSSWVETWTLTGIDQITHTGSLVRMGYFSHLTDGGLQEVHPEVLTLLPQGETTAERFRVAANRWVQRKLISKGRRPWLIWDQEALFEPERWQALALWANDAAMRTGGAPQADYARRAREYFDRADALFGEVNFRYDAEDSGTLDTTSVTTASPPVLMLSGQRPWAGAPWR